MSLMTDHTRPPITWRVNYITIPKPHVRFGPDGADPDEATAGYFREVIEKIDGGYANVGGSNVTAAVRKLLMDSAYALEGRPTQCCGKCPQTKNKLVDCTCHGNPNCEGREPK